MLTGINNIWVFKLSSQSQPLRPIWPCSCGECCRSCCYREQVIGREKEWKERPLDPPSEKLRVSVSRHQDSDARGLNFPEKRGTNELMQVKLADLMWECGVADESHQRKEKMEVKQEPENFPCNLQCLCFCLREFNRSFNKSLDVLQHNLEHFIYLFIYCSSAIKPKTLCLWNIILKLWCEITYHICLSFSRSVTGFRMTTSQW